jgi:hypothetical protein
MADAGIKKVIVLKKNLPALFGVDHNYIVRYRVVSEDKNRASHWSAQNKAVPPTTNTVNHSISVDSSAGVIRLVWDQVDSVSGYDIYVKWDSESWTYLGLSATNSYSSLIKNSSSSVKFAVQVPTFPKNRFTSSTIFETVSTSL